jgi:hypothetical protein
MSGISSTRIANWINVNCGNKFDPFRVTIKPPFLGVVIDYKLSPFPLISPFLPGFTHLFSNFGKFLAKTINRASDSVSVSIVE